MLQQIGMGRGYSEHEVHRKLIGILKRADTGMSGSELASHLGISRITLAKYLDLFESRGLVQARRAGNVNMWSMARASDSYEFPRDYIKAAPRYLNAIVSGDAMGGYTIIRNCMQSGASPYGIMSEIVLPAIQASDRMYADGRIGDLEIRLYRNAITASSRAMDWQRKHTPTKNCITLAVRPGQGVYGECVASALAAEGWRVWGLGDISGTVDVFFDIELQKVLGRVWEGTNGIMIILVFGGGPEEIKFLSESIRTIKAKTSGAIRLAFCTDSDASGADVASSSIPHILQWCETVHNSIDWTR